MKHVISIAIILAAGFINGSILMLFARHRRNRLSTQDGREWQQYKAKLPGWVKQTEGLLTVVLWLSTMSALMSFLSDAYYLAHPVQKKLDTVSAGLVIIPSLIATLAPAMVLVNIISWLIPPMRKANFAVMNEFETLSWRSATIDLAKMSSIVALASLPFVVLGVLAPWVN